MEQKPLIRHKVVDDREPGELRAKLLELGWEQRRLHSGDFYFQTHDFKKVGITRKEVNDLLASIGDRLSKHLEDMLDYYDINIFILEGKMSHIANESIVSSKGIQHYTWDMVWNYLHRYMAKGFILERTTSMGHTLHRLNALYALYQKSYSLSARNKHYTDDRVLAMPSGCRGESGMMVLRAFGSLRAVANASVEQLMSVNGIGAKRAGLIYSHFNREVANEDSKRDTQQSQQLSILCEPDKGTAQEAI